jgi:hypothetical protein
MAAGYAAVASARNSRTRRTAPECRGARSGATAAAQIAFR